MPRTPAPRNPAHRSTGASASLVPSDTYRGYAGELQQQAGGKHPVLTTAQGIPVADNQNSLRGPGAPGPTLLEDFVLREKLAHFNRERIAERAVFARGSGAHGFFELTRSLREHTTARVLTESGAQTPVFARFSTMAGGAGSVDTPRDTRGFAVKFYTREGNWDLVGSNVPVALVQDAMKFPDLAHALKMEPDRGFPQAASAHDTFWDFVSLMPEALHGVMWLMSDRALPRSLRMMEGFGVHSFRLVNAQGESTFARFHWRPRLGLQCTLWDEALKLQAADNDFHRRDLFEAIEAGDFPEWTLSVQLFSQEEAAGFPFDHLDATKLIPEELVPLQPIGRMVLNRWPDNFFADTEQVAFSPANVPPGIDFSNDPLLQGRLFAYMDAHLARLGGPNHAQLPINAPQCPYHHVLQGGSMLVNAPRGRVSYEPSSLQPDSPRAARSAGTRPARPAAQAATEQARGRTRPESFADHYSQARMFYRSQSTIEQAHTVQALVHQLSCVGSPHVRDAVVAHLQLVDQGLATQVAEGLGLPGLPEPPVPAVPVQDLALSPALRTIDRMLPTLQGRCVAILVADGSNGVAVANLRKALDKAGAAVKVLAPRVSGAVLRDGSRLAADGTCRTMPSVLFDAVAAVMTTEMGEALARDSTVVDWFRDAFLHLKAIAASRGSHAILKAGGIEPDAGVLDPADTLGFVAAAQTRQWEREAALRPAP